MNGDLMIGPYHVDLREDVTARRVVRVVVDVPEGSSIWAIIAVDAWRRDALN